MSNVAIPPVKDQTGLLTSAERRASLRSSGYRSLDQQANALGLHRATTWTIIRNKHKIGRLSKKTTNRILTNPKTPRAVRVVVRRYLAEQIEVAR